MADNAFSADVACLLQKSSYIFFSFDSNHCCSCSFFGSIIPGAHTYNCFVWVFFSTRLFGSKAIVCSDNMFKIQHALSLESLMIPVLSMPTYSKSLYISRVVSNFYGTEIEILAGFGPVCNTEKKHLGQLWATFENIFHVFIGKRKGLC